MRTKDVFERSIDRARISSLGVVIAWSVPDAAPLLVFLPPSARNKLGKIRANGQKPTQQLLLAMSIARVDHLRLDLFGHTRFPTTHNICTGRLVSFARVCSVAEALHSELGLDFADDSQGSRRLVGELSVI